ncbi:hypothetical protein [Halobellus marinus]|uniref:hypothetical protein n=1 Tax=Halobellus TaxID=1073986 RepID=UPI0028AA83A9|nr:hypothetical protein [Halobellus sp. DFY28]
MVDVRTLAAAVLGIGLGLLFVAAPKTVIQVHTAGRLPSGRHGRYGEDGVSGGSDARNGTDGTDTTDSTDGTAPPDDAGVPSQWRRLVQAVGIALILGGLYFGWTLV